MTKQELIKEVAKKAGITQATAADTVEAMRTSIMHAVKNTGRFALADFGVFTVVRRKERIAAGFGQKVPVPAHNAVKFKPSPAFKDVVNSPSSPTR